MTSEIAIPQPGRTPRWVRGAWRLCTRGPTYTLREIRKRVLRHAYLRGNGNSTRQLAPEQADPAITSTGLELRQRLLAGYRDKYRAAGYRVLMLRPPSLTSDIWFGDLQQCMNHLGIDCHMLPPDAPTAAINAEFEAFQPNVLIATESPASLGAIDLPRVLQYKRAHGCLRMLVPVWHSRAPRKMVPSGRSTPGQDEWRRRLRRKGLTADVHFSIFEPEFHSQFACDRDGPEVEYVAIPMACNPFVDYPVAAAKCRDYFIAASMTDERVEVSYRYLRPIVRQYRGLWAGPRWGFGTQSIAPAEMPRHYADARIALSPLVGFVHRYGAELTHRVYAAAACGAFQLTMSTSVTDRFFRPGELVRAGSPGEYARLFDHYVDRPLERNAIALAALRRAYDEHTCFHRIDKLVSHWNEWRQRGLF